VFYQRYRRPTLLKTGRRSAMTNLSWQEVGTVGLIKAAADARTLAMGIVGALAGAIVQSWLVFGIAGALYAVVVGVRVSRPAFWRRVITDLIRQPPRLPAEIELEDPAAQDLCRRVVEARNARERVLARGTAPSAEVATMVEQAIEVERQTAAMIQTLDRLRRHMHDLGTGTEGPLSTPRTQGCPDGLDASEADQSGDPRAEALARLATFRRRLVLDGEDRARALEAVPSCAAEADIERAARSQGIRGHDELDHLLLRLASVRPPWDRHWTNERIAGETVLPVEESRDHEDNA
jgi:hypothetical protein